MKLLSFLTLILLTPGLLCLLRTASKQQYISEQQLELKSKFKDYGQNILNTINNYRKLQFFQNKIQWKEELYDSADNEVRKIVSKNNFGDHDNFTIWENSIPNDYCTEIIVKLQFSDYELPTKATFSKYVLSALIEEQKFYIAQEYTEAGIAIMPQDETDKTVTYIVALHLVENTEKYSCKKALESGEKAQQVTINVQGNQETLKCDQVTEGGGWTLIADVDKYARGKELIIPLNDRGLQYTQILFVAKKEWYLNYNFGSLNNWDFDGYNFRFNCLRFGNAWYVDRSHDNYNVKYEIFDRAQDIQILESATKCYFGGAQQLYNCAKKFIFKSVPQGRLNAFSELQSAANTDLHNNIYRFYFQLYVR